MNYALLKSKRVMYSITQKALGEKLGLCEKTMNKKECSDINLFTADEMLMIKDELHLSLEEFDSIFFDNKLTKNYNNNNIGNI